MRNNAARDTLGDGQPFCERVVDVGLAASVLVAPLAMGGRFPVGRLLLAVIVAVTAISWFLTGLLGPKQRVSWFWTKAEWIIFLAILWAAVQVVPLPAKTIQWLSPELREKLPLHFEHSGLLANMLGVDATHEAGWTRLSLAPHATRNGLAMAIVYGLLFWVTSQRVKQRQDVERLLQLLASAGVLMAALGLAEYLFGNGKFLWFVEHPSRDTYGVVKGSFANENHFAHFLALTVGPLIWWLVQQQRATSSRMPPNKPAFARAVGTVPLNQGLLFVALGIVLVAGLLTYSRGGLAAMMLSATVTTGLFVWQRQLGRRALAGIVTAGGIAFAAVWIHGQELLVREMDSLRSVSVETLDEGQSRRKIWSAVLRAIPDFALAGTGVGSHRYVYPTYFSETADVQYTHAESGYLQVLLETGGIGLGLLLAGISISAYWLVGTLMGKGRQARSPRVVAMAMPLAGSWVASVAHAVIDFNWYIPANMTLMILVLAAASRLWQLACDRRAEREWTVSKGHWATAGLTVLVLATLSIGQLVAPARASHAWHEYRAWTLASKRFATKSTGTGRQRTLGAVNPADPNTVDSMISILAESLRRDPQNGRGHVRMAALCLQRFDMLQAQSENRMSLAQIRDAALSSEFPSHDAMVAWVDRVVGDHRSYLDRARRHALQGILLTPTEGSGYVYLSEVAFLQANMRGREQIMLEQAYAVRPFDPSVEFLLGHRKFLEGDGESAIALWKDAFRRGADVRQRIIAAIGFESPAQRLLAVFEPNLDGMRDMFDYYRSHRELEQQARYVGNVLVEELERQAQLISGMAAGPLWYDAQYVHSLLGNHQAAAAAAMNAVRLEPTVYRNHWACALRMREAGHYDESLRQLRWCQSRRGDREEGIANLIRGVEQAMASNIQAAATPSSTSGRRF